MTARRARTTRPSSRHVVLTARDLDIVHTVGRMGQATSEQIRMLFFGDPSTALRRLAKLVAGRYLDVAAPLVNAPNVYTLGARGVDVLAGADVDPATIHRSRVRRFDEHLLGLGNLRVGFIAGAKVTPGVDVLAFYSDLDLRRAAGSSPPAYIPDGIVELGLPQGNLALILEVDAGTESRSVFASKVVATVALWQAGGRCWGAAAGTWRPAVFVFSSARAKALARAIVDHGGGDLWLVAELPVVREVGIFGPVFATATDVAQTPRGAPVSYAGALVASRREVP